LFNKGLFSTIETQIKNGDITKAVFKAIGIEIPFKKNAE